MRKKDVFFTIVSYFMYFILALVICGQLIAVYDQLRWSECSYHYENSYFGNRLLIKKCVANW